MCILCKAVCPLRVVKNAVAGYPTSQQQRLHVNITHIRYWMPTLFRDSTAIFRDSTAILPKSEQFICPYFGFRIIVRLFKINLHDLATKLLPQLMFESRFSVHSLPDEWTYKDPNKIHQSSSFLRQFFINVISFLLLGCFDCVIVFHRQLVT